MKEQFHNYKPGKTSLKDKFKKQTERTNPIGIWITEKEKSCYICKSFETTYQRYLDTFFFMYKKDGEMTEMLKKSKGLCLHHFGDLCAAADLQLNEKQKDELFPLLFDLMQDNMKRVGEDVAWLVEKFDYRNKDADWKNSKDAIQRGMQKLWGGYPADPVYQQNK